MGGGAAVTSSRVASSSRGLSVGTLQYFPIRITYICCMITARKIPDSTHPTVVADMVEAV